MRTWGPSRFFLLGVVLGSLLGFVKQGHSGGRGDSNNDRVAADPHSPVSNQSPQSTTSNTQRTEALGSNEKNITNGRSLQFIKNFLMREKAKAENKKQQQAINEAERKKKKEEKKAKQEERAKTRAEKKIKNDTSKEKKNEPDLAGAAQAPSQDWSTQIADHSINPEQATDYQFAEEGPGNQNLPNWYDDYLSVGPQPDMHNWQQGSGENEQWSGVGDADLTPGSILSAARASISHYVQNGGHGLNGRRPSSEVNKSLGKCYRHVKFILKASGCTESVATGSQAKDAGPSLLGKGFRQINVSSPYAAPQGAVIVYQCGKYGHIEWKGPDGFYSDYRSTRALPCRNFAVYFKDTPQCTGKSGP